MIAVGVLLAPVAPPTQYQDLSHNLPFDSADFWVVDITENFRITLRMVLHGSSFRLPVGVISQGTIYKLTAYAVNNGVLDGVWWADGYFYDPDQVAIEFTSSGDSGGGDGEPGSFSGRVQVVATGVARQVVAVALDAAPPYLLAQTQSDPDGSYLLEWNGYSGQIMVTAIDDYGVDFVVGGLIGVGDRVHPSAPNGFVYSVANSGALGEAEPDWPLVAGDSVLSGEVGLVAVPFYRPKSAGPFFV